MSRRFLITLFLSVSILSLNWLVQACRNSQSTPSRATSGFIFKDKLSQYGFFRERLADLLPREGVIPYQLATPLFTDYALKDRFIVLPHLGSMHYKSQGTLEFPDSTIIIKNFAYRNPEHLKVMIETRLLVKDPADSKWKVMDYLWNKEQTDAEKHITGAKMPITLLNEEGQPLNTVYQVPNTNDCKRCHINNDQLTPIGPKAANLNLVTVGHSANQLEEWKSSGLLTGLPDLTMVNQFPDWRDSMHYSLEERARAYLDVNCAHCHTPGGDASNTGLFLDFAQRDPSKNGVMKAPVSAGGGAGGLDYDIVPGDAAHSVLAYRMNSAEPGTAMPELARTIIHREGVKLIKDWINSLPTEKK